MGLCGVYSKISRYQLVLFIGSSVDGPKLAVACAAVRRIQANKKYIPRNYEVSNINGFWRGGACVRYVDTCQLLLNCTHAKETPVYSIMHVALYTSALGVPANYFSHHCDCHINLWCPLPILIASCITMILNI